MTNSTWESLPNMGTTPSPNQSGNRKLMRSQINVHEISFATANRRMQAATLLATIATNERDKTT